MTAASREKELRRLQSCKEELSLSIPALLEGLDDSEASVRWVAVEVLGKLPVDELAKLVPLIESRIEHDECAKREAAVQVF